MSGNADFRDSIDKTREAFRRVEPEGHEPVTAWPSTPDDARREAVRAAVADVRAGVDPAPAMADAPALRGLHPFFQGLLDSLPEPGAEWPQPKREQWLETARNIFALLYVEQAEPPRMLRAIEPRALSNGPDAPSGYGASYVREESA